MHSFKKWSMGKQISLWHRVHLYKCTILTLRDLASVFVLQGLRFVTWYNAIFVRLNRRLFQENPSRSDMLCDIFVFGL